MPSHHLVLKPFKRLPTLGCILIALLAGMAASTRLNTSSASWPSAVVHGPAQPLSEATFLLTARHRALIWQPASATIPFALQSLDEPETPIGLLLYGDITPGVWQSVPALADSFHLVWIDSGERLRSALIHTSGDTLRGPVELSSRAGTQLAVVPTGNGGARVFWLSPSQQQIVSLAIDSDGRPGPSTALPARNVDYFAVAADNVNNTHLIWLSPLEADTWIIHYQYLENNLDWTAAISQRPETVYTLQLDPTESITTHAIGLDRSRAYAIIGTTDAMQPNREQVGVVVFSLNRPDDATYTNITLPASYNAANNISDVTFLESPLAPLADTTSADLAALRWPRSIGGQHDDFTLTVTLRSQGAWRPALVYFSDGDPVGYQLVTAGMVDTTADASPPSLARTASGDFYFTWAGLDHTEAQRVTIMSIAEGKDSTRPSTDNLLAKAAASIGIGSILSLAWVVTPALILALTPPNVWTPTLICALYSISKLLWPPRLFARVPPLLSASVFDVIDARIAVGLAVSLVTLIALASAWIVRNRTTRPDWQQWIVFGVVDSSLTWLIFGLNIVTWA